MFNEKEIIDILLSLHPEEYENLRNEVKTNEDTLRKLVKISVSDVKKASWRAAWILGNIAKTDPLILAPFINGISSKFTSSTDHSQVGCLLNVLTYTRFDLDDYGFLIDRCLTLLLVEKFPPYVKHYSLRLLKKFVFFYPELKGEILSGIQYSFDFQDSVTLKKVFIKTIMEIKAGKNLSDIRVSTLDPDNLMPTDHYS